MLLRIHSPIVIASGVHGVVAGVVIAGGMSPGMGGGIMVVAVVEVVIAGGTLPGIDDGVVNAAGGIVIAGGMPPGMVGGIVAGVIT